MYPLPFTNEWYERKDRSIFHAFNGFINGKKVSTREWFLELQESKPVKI